MNDRIRSSDTVEILDVLQLFWRQRYLVLVCLIACLAAGVAYINWVTPIHLATARLLVERQDVDLDRRVPLRYEPSFIQTQAEIVRSRTVVESALNTSGIPATIAEAVDPVGAAMDAIAVVPLEGTYVMQLSYRSTDSEEAVRTIESLIESYREYLRVSEKDTQSQTLILLTENEKNLRLELDEKETAYRELRSKSDLLGVGQDAGRVQAEYLTNLGKAFTEATSRRMQLQNQVAIWKKSPMLANPERPLPNLGVVQASYTVDDASNVAGRYGETFALPKTQKPDHVAEIRDLQKQLIDAQSWEEELDRSYGDSHPDLREVRTQIKAKQLQLKEMVAAIPRVFEDELDAVRMHERELEVLYSNELKNAKKLDLHELEEQQLLSSVERLRGVHDSILSEMRNRQTATASAENGHGIVHVKMIAAARASGNPVWPIPEAILAICSIVGLGAGAALALLIETVGRHSRRRRSYATQQNAKPYESQHSNPNLEPARQEQVANAI